MKSSIPNSTILGFDLGFFSHSLSSVSYPPEKYLDIQYFGDVRKFPYEILHDVDVVIYDESLNAIQTNTVTVIPGYNDVAVNFELTPGRYYIGMPDTKQLALKN